MSDLELESRFYEIVDSVVPLEPHQKERETSLQELGMDSLDLVELVQECEDEFGVVAADDTVDKWATLGDVIDFIIVNQGQ